MDKIKIQEIALEAGTSNAVLIEKAKELSGPLCTRHSPKIRRLQVQKVGGKPDGTFKESRGFSPLEDPSWAPCFGPCGYRNTFPAFSLPEKGGGHKIPPGGFPHRSAVAPHRGGKPPLQTGAYRKIVVPGERIPLCRHEYKMAVA